MKNRIKRGSLFTLLLGNYIIFTILVVVMFIAAIGLAIWGNQLNLVDFEQISNYDSLLAKGQYEQFPAERLLGKEGAIAILDEKGQTVYHSGEQKLNLSVKDIDYIPDALAQYYIDTREIQTFQGVTNYEILISWDDSRKDLFILDSSYKVIYSSEDCLGRQLSETAYLLLSNQFFDNYTVKKYGFNDQNGNPYTMLLFSHTDAAFEELKKLGIIFSQFMLYFTLLYGLLILLLIVWLKEKINKPLRLLCSTFNDYQIGKSTIQDYHGPKEFVNIFENFSAMSQRLEVSEKQKNALEENRRKMVADIVHDFKTPIAVIQGYAKAAADGVIPGEELPKYLGIIDQKATQLNGLILTFYEYSKMEHPDFKFTLEETDLCNYFRDFIAEQYSELELSGFQVEADLPEVHVFCGIDRIQLRRAFENIVGNVVNHTKTGTTIYFGLKVTEETVILTLADNGSGLPDEIAENIFTPFVTGDRARKGGGSGLGMSIAKKIVEGHHGMLRLVTDGDSRWRTMFQIILPVSKHP